MNEDLKHVILKATGAKAINDQQLIQELWSGYGKILRVTLKGDSSESVVVKHVQSEQAGNHPRGWNSDIGHQRKLKSYDVETTWYERYSADCLARVPRCLAVDHIDNEVVIILEDLDATSIPIKVEKE